ncbi:MAG: hypothetical protein ACFFD4_04305 [Candidatus Odinarchaeota archaeon]
MLVHLLAGDFQSLFLFFIVKRNGNSVSNVLLLQEVNKRSPGYLDCSSHLLFPATTRGI